MKETKNLKPVIVKWLFESKIGFVHEKKREDFI